MTEFFRILLAMNLIAIGAVFAAVAVCATRVLVDFIRRGPVAAVEAYDRGATIARWWRGFGERWLD